MSSETESQAVVPVDMDLEMANGGAADGDVQMAAAVASESAFSTGGRVLDDFRTSLTPFMVEALVCTQDWIRHETPIDVAENTEELDKLEKELIAEYKENKAKKLKPTTSKKPT